MNNFYCFEKIGARIKEERLKKGLTLIELTSTDSGEGGRGLNIGITRQTLSNLEKGKAVNIGIEPLLNLCNIFECDLAYLLCEQNCKRRLATDIQQETGLSEEAINSITSNKGNRKMTAFLSNLLEDTESLYFIASAYGEYKEKINSAYALRQYAKSIPYSPEQEDIEASVSIKTRDAEFELFRCQNLFLMFVQKEMKSNAKKTNS